MQRLWDSAAGFFVGYALLPDWAPLTPRLYWHWLPYVACATAICPIALSAGVSALSERFSGWFWGAWPVTF